MAGLSVNEGALTQGIETGMRIRGFQANQRRARKQEKRNDEMYELNKTLQQMQLESLKDEQVRNRMKRDLNATLFHLRKMKEDPEYVDRLKENPEMAEQIENSIQGVGDFMVNRGVDDGRPRKFKGFVPTEDGRVMVKMDVFNDDGSIERDKPLSRDRSARTDDPPVVMGKDEIVGDMMKMDALIDKIDQVEANLIRLGDTGPMERQAAGLKRKQAIEDREDEQAHDVRLQGLKNRGRVGGGATQGDIQLMNYFQTQPGPDGKPIASNAAEARELVRSMKTDPNKMVVDIANTLYENEVSTRRQPFEQYIRQAQGYVENLTQQRMGGLRGGGQGGEQQGTRENPVQIQGDEDYQKLPSGTYFRAPDNTIRQKP